MAEISERHEVTVRSDGRAFVFVADDEEGRLVIRQEGDGEEVCSLSVEDPGELQAFFEGLRRVLGSSRRGGEGGAPDPPARPEPGSWARTTRRPGRIAGPGPETPAGPGREGQEEQEEVVHREEMIARAREKSPNAFARWTPEEEHRLATSYRAGESVESLARSHRRSRRAIEIRLGKLGLLEDGGP